MSFNLLVISEDPTNNGYIFIPLIKRMMKECGKPNSRVALMTDPKASGYENAKYLIREVVIEPYAYKDLLLFLPDADGKDRSQEFASLEAEAMAKGVNLLCCAAVQEVEAWLLAGHLDKLDTVGNPR